MAEPVADTIVNLTAAVAKMKGTAASAAAALRGVRARIEAAVAAALANGATEAELEPFRTLDDELVASEADLAAAVAENP
jgi:hypothetical protein